MVSPSDLILSDHVTISLLPIKFWLSSPSTPSFSTKATNVDFSLKNNKPTKFLLFQYYFLQTTSNVNEKHPSLSKYDKNAFLRQTFHFWPFTFFGACLNKDFKHYFWSTTLSCKPFIVQPNSNMNGFHRHFFNYSRSLPHPRTQLRIFSFRFLRALHQAVLFDVYW